MNPGNNEASGMQLPPPVVERGNVAGAQPEANPQAPETGNAASPERSLGTPAAAVPMMAIPLPTPPVMPAQSGRSKTSTNTTTKGLSALQDTDLIEKEWVNKAKQIVERTRDDPYKQSEELTGVKVDYMKKRYNKSIKLNK